MYPSSLKCCGSEVKLPPSILHIAVPPVSPLSQMREVSGRRDVSSEVRLGLQTACVVYMCSKTTECSASLHKRAVSCGLRPVLRAQKTHRSMCGVCM